MAPVALRSFPVRGVVGAVVMVLTVVSGVAVAVPPSPHPIEDRQPDGTPVRVFLRGGAELNWYEDAEGYAVVKVPGAYAYAVRGADGALVATPLRVGAADPSTAGLRRGIVPASGTGAAPGGGSPPRPGRDEVVVDRPGGGGSLVLRLRGDERSWWYEDPAGYTAVEIPARYEYALRGPEGRLVPSGLLVAKVDPKQSGLEKGVRPVRP